MGRSYRRVLVIANLRVTRADESWISQYRSSPSSSWQSLLEHCTIDIRNETSAWHYVCRRLWCWFQLMKQPAEDNKAQSIVAPRSIDCELSP